MGATNTNTLADYLVSIRTKKQKGKRRNHSSTLQQNKQQPQRRSLAQEIWNAPNNVNIKRRARPTPDQTRTKRRRMSEESFESSISSSSSGFQKTSPSFGCTLQPFFTKDEDVQQRHHHLAQYRFEFSPELLEEISLQEMQSNNVFESSACSIISQITQDSSLLEEVDRKNDGYSYSSESDNNDISSDDEEASESSSISTDHYYQNFEPSSRRRTPDGKNAEVKEGAQLLLDLLSM